MDRIDVGGSSEAALRSTSVAGIEDLSVCRSLVAELVSDCAPEMRLDAEVVVSELVTNAFQHSPAEAVQVLACRDVDQLSLTVTSTSTDRPDQFEPDPEFPDPDQTRGRGIPIVRALTDSYRVLIEGGLRRDLVVMSTRR